MVCELRVRTATGISAALMAAVMFASLSAHADPAAAPTPQASPSPAPAETMDHQHMDHAAPTPAPTPASAEPAAAQAHERASHGSPTPSPAPQSGEPAAPAAHEHAQHDMSMDMGHSMSDPGAALLMQHASGTSMNPASAPMPMSSTQVGDWHLMGHGLLYLNYTDQGGLRGDEKAFSTNWLMGMAHRKLGRGTLMLRTMLSLEPATISDKEYPLLFQSGETANGLPIVDGQHPHEFFMEIAAEYAHPIGEQAWFTTYLAPVGDPGLGPVAFPHRDSALEIPQATLSHHYQDSTHIATSVINAGVNYRTFRLEGSVFHGAEPDEDRWDIEMGTPDSWAVRLSYFPSPNWVAQFSTGFLKKPEALEPGDSTRKIASLAHHLPFDSGAWSTSLIWGQVYKESHDQTLDSYLFESTVNFARRHYVTSRAEFVDKDEIFPHLHPPGTPLGQKVPVFRVNSYTLGYTFDVLQRSSFRAGVGANYTRYDFPTVLGFFYGEDPDSWFAFFRIRSAAK